MPTQEYYSHLTCLKCGYEWRRSDAVYPLSIGGLGEEGRFFVQDGTGSKAVKLRCPGCGGSIFDHSRVPRPIYAYMDESYDSGHTLLLLGVLCSPSPGLHHAVTDIKERLKFASRDGALKEIKYSNIRNAKAANVCRAVIDAFLESSCWFRAIIVDERVVDLSNFGSEGEPDRMRRARMYKHFAERLIAWNCPEIVRGKLFADELQRHGDDRFLPLMRRLFCQGGVRYYSKSAEPRFTTIEEVNSRTEKHNLVQVCDLLLGCVLNAQIPSSKNKTAVRQYLAESLGAPLTRHYWHDSMTYEYLRKKHPDFHIQFFP